MHNKEDIKKTLVEVRKAYRLLYSYQKGILNLMNYIGKRLGFTFENIEPRFSNKSNYTKLKKNAWDWLNLYCCAFHFKGQEIEGKERWFSIFLITDTGFFDTGLYKNNAKPHILIDELDKYEEPGKSNSKLVFVIGGHREFDVKNDKNYFKAYENILKEEEGEYEKKGEKIFYKHYNLHDFLDENNAEKSLNDFVVFCEKEIPLELKDKTGN